MKYVVIGASAAGLSGIDTLRQNDKDAEIVLIAPDEAIHSRCILHRFIGGERDLDNLSFVEDGFIENKNVTWKKTKATGLDLKAKQVATEDCGNIGYDKLLIAAGSVTRTPPIKNLDGAKKVYSLNCLEDAVEIKQDAAKAKNIAVIGAGLIGVDVISGLLDFGAQISCYEFGPHMMPLVLDKYSAEVYQKLFAEKGVQQHYGVQVEEILLDANGCVTGLKLKDGRTFACDMLIVATGIKANVDFLRSSGLELSQKGLIYNGYGQTSDPNVYAAGDISGMTPIWSAAVKEGIIAANNMSGVKSEMTDFFAVKSTMNFLDVPTMALGVAEKSDDSYAEIVDVDTKGNYKKVIHKDGQIKGAILQGDLSYAGILTQLIREKINITRVKKPLFKVDYSDFFGEFEF